MFQASIRNFREEKVQPSEVLAADEKLESRIGEFCPGGEIESEVE